MASSKPALEHSTLVSRLAEARLRTDALFNVLHPNSYYERPIPERHRLIFYLGHLEAFDWNLLSTQLNIEPHNAEYDRLFAFGIDPIGGGLPTDEPKDWPSINLVRQYNDTGRNLLSNAITKSLEKNDRASVALNTRLNVAIEHRLMHAETLSYLFHNLPVDKKLPQPENLSEDSRPTPEQRSVAIPDGVTELGLNSNISDTFGWDNEFEAQQISVPAFSIDKFPVTNAAYLEFVRAGGYQNRDYWTPQDWDWKTSEGLWHPRFWEPNAESASPESDWKYRGMFRTIPLPPSWPVYVSHAEASAYARWAGKKLPTEVQWHRAAYGTPDGTERQFPWGGDAPNASHGNFHYKRWDPTAVDEHPDGASAFGVHDLLGNGWEWTSSVFAPLPGFTAFPFYPGYSADFFDGKHFVMKGGSPRTDACMLRRSFRNWFQPHYPYVYTKFRCVEE